MLAELGVRLGHLAVDREVHEVLALVVDERPPDEAELGAACSTRSVKSRSLNVKRSSPYSST